jgi:hypothetical protein
MMCNFIVSVHSSVNKDDGLSVPLQGNERWVEQLDTKFLEEFTGAKSIPWITLGSGKIAGVVRSAGGGGFTAGNITFVNVHEAGYVGRSWLLPF